MHPARKIPTGPGNVPQCSLSTDTATRGQEDTAVRLLSPNKPWKAFTPSNKHLVKRMKCLAVSVWTVMTTRGEGRPRCWSLSSHKVWQPFDPSKERLAGRRKGLVIFRFDGHDDEGTSRHVVCSYITKQNVGSVCTNKETSHLAQEMSRNLSV